MTRRAKNNRNLIGPLWLVGFFTFALLMLYGSTHYRSGPIFSRNGAFVDRKGQNFSEAEYRSFLRWELCTFGACAATLAIGALGGLGTRARPKRTSRKAPEQIARPMGHSADSSPQPGAFMRLLSRPANSVARRLSRTFSTAPATKEIPVYLSAPTRLRHLTATLIVIALPVWLFLYGWFFQDAEALVWLTGFGIFVSGVTLLSIRKSKLLRFDSAPAFVIRPSGVEIPPGKELPWRVLRDAVVFTHEGHKAIGLRLRQDLDPDERAEIERQFARSLDWELFGLPLTMSFYGLSLSGEDLVTLLQEHGLKVTTMEEEIHFGEGSKLS